MKILFATPECAPYVKTGGLGDVSGALPATLAAMGHEVRVLLPAYRNMKMSGELGDTVELPPYGPFPAAQLVPVHADNGVTVLLLACPSLYQRSGGPYVDPQGRDYIDNAVRFGFLARVAALLGTVHSPCRDWQAEVVHANDWPTALAPMYLAEARALAPHENAARSVLTIHNIAFQGVFPMHTADMLGVPAIWRGMDGVEFWGQLSMLKAGVQFADAVTTVSPTYAREIQTEAFGVGMDGVLQAHHHKLSGILNGIDTNVWNPEKDKLIPHCYSAAYPGAKAQDKAVLQQRCGLAQDPKAMVFGVVSRLTPQKGIDLVLGALEQLLAADAQLVVLGQGDPGLQNALRAAAERYPRQVSVTVGFDEEIAHLVEAGADCFLMPSRFEPCGLNQMYSQAYGTPPLVGNVGGLVDSVTDATIDPTHGTGFVMRGPNADAFAEALSRAIKAYREPMRWRRIMANGMARHFGWEESAAHYVEVYERVLGRRSIAPPQAGIQGVERSGVPPARK